MMNEVITSTTSPMSFTKAETRRPKSSICFAGMLWTMDSIFKFSAFPLRYKLGDRIVTYSYIDINKPGQLILRLEACK
jgi:hypothetical protein